MWVAAAPTQEEKSPLIQLRLTSKHAKKKCNPSFSAHGKSDYDTRNEAIPHTELKHNLFTKNQNKFFLMSNLRFFFLIQSFTLQLVQPDSHPTLSCSLWVQRIHKLQQEDNAPNLPTRATQASALTNGLGTLQHLRLIFQPHAYILHKRCY